MTTIGEFYDLLQQYGRITLAPDGRMRVSREDYDRVLNEAHTEALAEEERRQADQ